MSLLDTLRKNLSPELFAQVTDALGDDFNYDQVPRSRLNKVISQRDEANRKLEAFTHGADGDDDDDDDDDGAGGGTPAKQKKTPTGKQLTQKDIEDAVQAEKDKAAEEMKNLRLRYAVTEKLRGANVVDPDMVFSAGLIDLTKITTDDTGAITGGLDDQISEMVKARPYLVAQAGGGTPPTGTGKSGGSDDFSTITSKDEFLKLPTEKQLEFKKANPDVFKSFMSQI